MEEVGTATGKGTSCSRRGCRGGGVFGPLSELGVMVVQNAQSYDLTTYAHI